MRVSTKAISSAISSVLCKRISLGAYLYIGKGTSDKRTQSTGTLAFIIKNTYNLRKSDNNRCATLEEKIQVYLTSSTREKSVDFKT